jgi:uncharacterized protein
MNTPAIKQFDSKNDAQAPVPSPCISVCRMSPYNGLCVGCFRTLDEIAAWGQASNDTKRAIWASIDARRTATLSTTTKT